jgi:hypothetical protein
VVYPKLLLMALRIQINEQKIRALEKGWVVTALYSSITTITREWNGTALELTRSKALLKKKLPDLEG